LEAGSRRGCGAGNGNSHEYQAAGIKVFPLDGSTKLIDQGSHQPCPKAALSVLRTSNPVVCNREFDVALDDFAPDRNVTDLIVCEGILEGVGD
jgi:hypothetical protein